MKESSTDQRSKKFIFVPFCLICQAFQAKGIVRFGFSSVMKPVLDMIIENDLNIIQMPCPESRLGGYSNGLNREPKGINDYNTPDFLEVCKSSAKEVVAMVEGILANGFEIVAILGIEYSPSCSVNLQYTNKGTIHRQGHFIAILEKMLLGKNIEIPFLGINRRGVNPSLERLKKLLEGKEKELF